MSKIIPYLIIPFVMSFINYVLYCLFKKFRLYKLALYNLAYCYAPICNEKRANKLYCYCKKYCPNRSCNKCRLWTCKGEK